MEISKKKSAEKSNSLIGIFLPLALIAPMIGAARQYVGWELWRIVDLPTSVLEDITKQAFIGAAFLIGAGLAVARAVTSMIGNSPN